VAPYTSGPGGDCFALVWDSQGLAAYNGSGRAPAAATLEALRAATGREAPSPPERAPARPALRLVRDRPAQARRAA
jgi:gamma-glutamyltranspeptidase/glutathione hydrolase